MSVVSFSNPVTLGPNGIGLGVLWQTGVGSLVDIWTNKIYPRRSLPANVEYFNGKSFRVINLGIHSNTVGSNSVAVTYPISLSTTTSNTYCFGYAFDYSVYSYITIQASPAYGKTFINWSTAPGGGTVLSTSATLNLYNNTWVSNSQVYANFS